MKKPPFVPNQIYHIYNRGVEKRNVFLDDSDYSRFIHDLFEFNDISPVSTTFYRHAPKFKPKLLEVEPPTVLLRQKPSRGPRPGARKPRIILIEILAFCLMPNHFHLLVRQLKEKGIVRFMQKLGTGYTMYFNEKYQREGALFQGRFKAVLIEQQSHFIHIPYYIHSNPLDLVMPEWRKRKLRDPKKAIRFLESYRWSSHPDYLGKKNLPSITSRQFLLDCFGGTEGYRRIFETWLNDFDVQSIENLTLEPTTI